MSIRCIKAVRPPGFFNRVDLLITGKEIPRPFGRGILIRGGLDPADSATRTGHGLDELGQRAGGNGNGSAVHIAHT